MPLQRIQCRHVLGIVDGFTNRGFQRGKSHFPVGACKFHRCIKTMNVLDRVLGSLTDFALEYILELHTESVELDANAGIQGFTQNTGIPFRTLEGLFGTKCEGVETVSTEFLQRLVPSEAHFLSSDYTLLSQFIKGFTERDQVDTFKRTRFLDDLLDALLHITGRRQNLVELLNEFFCPGTNHLQRVYTVGQQLLCVLDTLKCNSHISKSRFRFFCLVLDIKADLFA